MGLKECTETSVSNSFIFVVTVLVFKKAEIRQYWNLKKKVDIY